MLELQIRQLAALLVFMITSSACENQQSCNSVTKNVVNTFTLLKQNLRGGKIRPSRSSQCSEECVRFTLDGIAVSLPLSAVNSPYRDAPTPLFAAAAEGCVEGVEALLAAGASTQVTDENGDTALTVAAYNGCAAAVACLASHGASIDHRNRFGATPLHAAAAGGCAEAAQVLVGLGADCGAADDAGLTAREMAAGCGHGGELLAVLGSSRPAAPSTQGGGAEEDGRPVPP